MDTLGTPRLAAALADRYRVDGEIGAGGMATVYRAYDLKHGREVALKVLRPELAVALGEERFLAEIQLTATLRHPGIVPLFDSGSTDAASGERYLWYTMPLIAGETLRAYLARAAPLPVAEAVRLAREIAEALAAAHTRGVVHRDVKPDNVLLDQGHAVVTDFGIAHAVSQAGADRLTGTGLAVGTPAYMSPEQAAADRALDGRADQYALGCLLYEMLTGVRPFTGDTASVVRQHLVAEPPDVRARRAEVPTALGAVIRRAMAKEPAHRFGDLGALVTALDAAVTPAVAPRRAGWRAALVGGAVVAVVAAGLLVRQQRARWVPEVGIPELRRLTEAEQPDSAFELFSEIQRRAPGDTSLEASWRSFSTVSEFLSEPAGATVTRARVDDTTTWLPVGTTPTKPLRVPSNAWYYRYEKPGYRPVTMLSARVGGAYVPVPSPVLLRRVTDPDTDMVALSGTQLVPTLYGLSASDTVNLAPFLMDKREVTNRQYAAFVNAGGYARREWWDSSLVVNGREVPFAQFVATLTDRTGRAGPSTWEGGAPVAGTEDFPVGGVSWYEARAYARFVGKSLPTVVEWNEAAIPDAARWVVPRGHYQAAAPVRGGAMKALGARGVYDLAGNVREWTVNAEAPGTRYILGGGFADPPYLFSEVFVQSELDRAPINGIRLVRRLGDAADLARAMAPIRRLRRDYARVQPVDEATYRGYAALYAYDRVPLNARLEHRDTTIAEWVREDVTVDLPGGARLPVVMILPKQGRPPYQPIVLWPASDAQFLPNTQQLSTWFVDFLVRGGRAVIYPVYENTYGRGGRRPDEVEPTVAHRERVRRWVTEMRRAVDYAFTRADIDTTRLSFVGFSWGGRMAPLALALEPRIKTAVLNVAGLPGVEPLPEENAVNFLPRVRVPVLMLGGRFDSTFPLEASQRPFFTLLGSRDKRLILYDAGHFLPRTELVRESLTWLDRVLGPVTP